ncbi:MAG: hypothetical protein ACI94Y_000406 [Maribacter sp.]
MNKNDLKEIIDKIESSNSTETAFMAIHQYGGGPDESFAKANKEGLELFALQFLKASRDIEEVIENPNQDVIILDYEGDWIEGEIFIHHIEPINKDRKLIIEENYKETFLDKLIPFGCFLIIGLIVFSIIVGLATIAKWIF